MDEYIDIVEVLNKKEYSGSMKKLLLDKNVLVHEIGLFFSTSAGIINHDILLSSIWAINGALQLFLIRQNLKDTMKKHLEKESINKLKSTMAYQELDGLYNEYLDNLSKLFKDLGLSNSLDIASFYQSLLNLGYLSSTHVCESKKYKNSLDWDLDLLGSTVTTGKCVCRHKASMLTDLYNKMSINSCSIAVNMTKDINDIKKQSRNANHLVCGIIDDNKKYVYDPSWSAIGIFNEDKKDVAISTNDTYYILGTTQLQTKYSDKYKKFKKSKAITLDKDILQESISFGTKKLVTNLNDVNSYYYDSKKLLDDISKLNEIVFPRSDEELSKCLIK